MDLNDLIDIRIWSVIVVAVVIVGCVLIGLHERRRQLTIKELIRGTNLCFFPTVDQALASKLAARFSIFARGVGRKIKNHVTGSHGDVAWSFFEQYYVSVDHQMGNMVALFTAQSFHFPSILVERRSIQNWSPGDHTGLYRDLAIDSRFPTFQRRAVQTRESNDSAFSGDFLARLANALELVPDVSLELAGNEIIIYIDRYVKPTEIPLFVRRSWRAVLELSPESGKTIRNDPW